MSNSNVVYHTIRNASGTWQNFFGLVESEVSGGPLRFAAVGCAGTGDLLQAVGVGTDGQLYHTIRDADGTWQKDFRSVASEVCGGSGSFVQVACGGVGGALHVLATGSDEQLYHTVRNADGTWQNTFGLIEAPAFGGPRVLESVSCAGVETDLQVVGTAAGSIYHTIRDASGHWQNPFGIVETQVFGGPANGFFAVGCAGVGDIFEIVAVGSDGELYHTIRNPNGTWQNFFGLIESMVSGGPAKGFGRVSCSGAGNPLEIVGLGSDGELYHTIRNPNGTWQSFGLVESQVTGGPPEFTAVSCAGVGSDLHVVGGAFPGGFV